MKMITFGLDLVEVIAELDEISRDQNRLADEQFARFLSIVFLHANLAREKAPRKTVNLGPEFVDKFDPKTGGTIRVKVPTEDLLLELPRLYEVIYDRLQITYPTLLKWRLGIGSLLPEQRSSVAGVARDYLQELMSLSGGGGDKTE